ncbi:unnamed protein product [Ilex paraguariensis]|uniref:Disease resistance R13L4/SHOC-2-like LRR domain-containing protein n=1 Tax=Ilex paraguariensis TaxID=185542 RepID=A0ABC8QVF5_9AQUA
MVLNLRGCCNITDIPDLSGHPALEKLILEGCINLARIHKSLGEDLNKLRQLNLRACSSLVEFPSDVSGLRCLENLILSGCSNLKYLPQDLASMSSLRELLLDETAIEKLPESVFRLTKLESLSLKMCRSLKRLPLCIGKLASLRELSVDNSALEEIPDTIGSLGKLETLSVMWCRSLTVLPNSVGKLKSLTKLWLNSSAVKEMPASIGSICYLKELSVGDCYNVSTLPASIEGLYSMVDLQLDGTSIKDLPDQIGGLKSLKKLQMRNCESLRSLPESIGKLLSLNTLIIENAAITELPESIGMLENLMMLRLNQCKQLYKLPASFGKLKSLHHLLMEDSSVTELPENFGMLSCLMILKMAKNPYHKVPQNTEITELKDLATEKKSKLIVLPSSFSNLSSLVEFDARAWKISGNMPDDFGKLSSLENLNLAHNDFSRLPSSLRGLSVLQKLVLTGKYIQPVRFGELTRAAPCNCENLEDIPGLECLKSLRKLHMVCCKSCSSVVMEKLDKAAVKNMDELSFPGSEIPDWFTQGVVSFSRRKNYAIRSVIIGVVVSVNHQITDESRDQHPLIPDLIVTILRLNEPVHRHTMRLATVPKTDEDQVYLCRYEAHRSLVFMLEDGDRIRVAMRDPPYVKGVELKKFGTHLVFENDDDFDGDEDNLDESQQSVSGKLTSFIRFSKANNHTSDSSHELRVYSRHEAPTIVGFEED